MTRARKELVSLDTTPYYHCICRCVRRAFLCGEDHLTGNNYEHRKPWVLERLKMLAKVFSIEICAYAVMSNHYHLVVRIDKGQADRWSDEEVMRRWGRLFTLPLIVERYAKNLTTTLAEQRQAQKVIAEWRERLADLSWYMRCLNEHLARRANEEDGCKGRFWEGRYKSQALLDEAAVLTCMSYVDLNPVRAGIAETPEGSDFTSIQQRIRQWTKTRDDSRAVATQTTTDIPLMRLSKKARDTHPNAFSFSPIDYFELVDWAGRAIRADKRGHIPEDVPPILTRLGIAPSAYLQQIKGQTARPHPIMLGHAERLRLAAHQLGRKFIKGIKLAEALYPTPSS